MTTVQCGQLTVSQLIADGTARCPKVNGAVPIRECIKCGYMRSIQPKDGGRLVCAVPLVARQEHATAPRS